jgi:hypothetical protein
VVAGLFRSVPVDETLVSAVRALQREVDVAIAADGVDPVVAQIVRLAVDGLYIGDVFKWVDLSAEERGAVLGRLRRMTEEAVRAGA